MQKFRVTGTWTDEYDTWGWKSTYNIYHGEYKSKLNLFIVFIYGEKKNIFCWAEKVYLPGSLLVNINKHMYMLKWTPTSCFNCLWNAVLFLFVTSCFISFVFCVPLQIYAGLNHVIASQFIVKEPNHLNRKNCVTDSHMTEDSHLERSSSRLNWGNKSLFWIMFRGILLCL